MKKNINKSFSGYRMAIACFIYLMVFMGTFNVLAVALPCIVIETDYTIAQASIMVACAGLASALANMFITPKALQKITPKGCMFVATILLVIYMLWIGFTTSLWQMYVSSIIGGIAIGLAPYIATSALISNWFVKNRLSIIGLVSAGGSLGTAIFQMIAGQLLSRYGYQFTYRVLSIIVLIITGIILPLIIRNDPSELEQKALGADEIVSSDSAEVSHSGITAKEALKTPAFYVILIACFIGSIAYIGTVTYVPALLTGDGYHMSTVAASNYSAFLYIMTTVMLALSGKIAEKFGVKLYTIYVGIALAAGITIFLTAGNLVVSIPALCIIALILISVGSSHQPSDPQILTISVFGHRDFSTIQAYMMAGVGFGGGLTSFIVSGMLGTGLTLLQCFVLFLVGSILWAVLVFIGLALSPLKKKH